MTVECPHCFATVLPMSDGACPSCGKDVNDRTSLGEKMTVITVHTGDSFPPFCAMCAKSADMMLDLSQTSVQGGHSWIESLILALLPFSVSSKEDRGIEHRITLNVPLCRLCAESHEVKLMHVDTENFSMKLLVGKPFAEKIREHRTST